MTMTWHLRGYHRPNGTLGFDLGLTPAMRLSVDEVLRASEDEPDLVDPYELARDQTVRMAEALDIAVDLDRFDYFVESEEDWRVVAIRRDALRAQA